jgi:hypothetical protein
MIGSSRYSHNLFDILFDGEILRCAGMMRSLKVDDLGVCKGSDCKCRPENQEQKTCCGVFPHVVLADDQSTSRQCANGED